MDIAAAMDSFSPTTGTIIDARKAGKSYLDILRGWKNRASGDSYVNRWVGLDKNGRPYVKTQEQVASELLKESKELETLGLKRAPSVADDMPMSNGGKLNKSFDMLRNGQSDSFGELKPLRRINKGAIDFVEFPEEALSTLPKGFLDRLKNSGIRYQTYNLTGKNGVRRKVPVSEFIAFPDARKVREAPTMFPQAFREASKGGDTRTGTQQASKAGDSPRRADLSNFLATDEVPETLFGIPIVASPEQYTEADIAFFKEHPRAGGFYELGDEDADTQAATGAEGTSEELPRYYKVQPGDNLSKISKATGVPYANIAKYSKLADPNKIRVGQVLLLTEPYPGKWNNPGNVRWNRKVVREGETGKVKSKVTDGYFLTFDTPQNGLNAQAQVIGAIARSTIPERYQKGELPNSKFTISNLINVYAPPKDKNDTPGYIKFVADELGVDKDAELNIDNVKQMSSLLRAIVTRDSKPEYAEWFRDSEYAEAVKKMKTPVKGREEPGKKGK